MSATFSPTLGMNTKNEKKIANRQIEVSATFTPHYQLKVIIKGDMPKSMNQVKAQTWKRNGSDARKWKRLIGEPVEFFQPIKLLQKYSVVAVRHSSRMLDYDNLVASLKPCIDALKGIVVKDDSFPCTGPWNVDQKFRSRAEGSLLEIIITESA